MFLQMGTFHLKVRRDIDGPAFEATAAPVMAVSAAPVAAAPALPAYVSLDAAEPEESMDEGLVYVNTPKVTLTDSATHLCL